METTYKGLTTPPTDLQLRAVFASGGFVVASGVRPDGVLDAHAVTELDAAQALAHVARQHRLSLRWVAFDRRGIPCAWPVGLTPST